MKKNARTVYLREDGQWANKRNNSERVSSLHSTQKQAENAARKMLKNQGGGELVIKDENGKIRSKDTIAGANDPNPPKDKKH